jgi:hypothetical protein
MRRQTNRFGIAHASHGGVGHTTRIRKEKTGCLMKSRKLIRWQLILAGLGTALLFTASAQAQEITNTAFDDGPNVTSFAQPSADQSAVASTQTQPGTPSIREFAAIESSLSAQHVALIDSPVVAAGLTLLLFVCIAISAIGESKRVKRNGYVRRYASNRSA